MKTAEQLLEEAASNLGYGDIDEMLIVEPYSVVRSIVLSRMQTYADHLKNDWVSVEDRLPEENQKVLCYDKDGYIAAEYLNRKFDDLNDWFSIESVTHWQPLPSPPKTTEI